MNMVKEEQRPGLNKINNLFKYGSSNMDYRLVSLDLNYTTILDKIGWKKSENPLS